MLSLLIASLAELAVRFVMYTAELVVDLNQDYRWVAFGFFFYLFFLMSVIGRFWAQGKPGRGPHGS